MCGGCLVLQLSLHCCQLCFGSTELVEQQLLVSTDRLPMLLHCCQLLLKLLNLHRCRSSTVGSSLQLSLGAAAFICQRLHLLLPLLLLQCCGGLPGCPLLWPLLCLLLQRCLQLSRL